MSVPACGCRVYGNQYGSFFRPCAPHSDAILEVCAFLGITPREFLRRAIDEAVKT